MLTILLSFFTRTVFIAVLGKSYLGIDGLFTNILTMLSLAEFGFGSAILYKLYDPIAREDHHRIAVLMNFYKAVYRIIGLLVAVLGLCLIPFFPSLISDYDTLADLNINAALIFCIFLLKTVSSYLFFAYKSAIIKANQKEYLVNIVGYFFAIGAAVVQIICLYLFRSFTIYIAVSVLQVIGQNICCAIMADRMYAFLKAHTSEKLDRKEAKSIFKDCAALFLYKMNDVVLKATDNIVLSKFLGLAMVGMYSNYYILYAAIKGLFSRVFNSVAHSLGNLHTGTDRKHEYTIFESVMFIAAILGGTAFIGVFVASDELVNVWIGTEWVLAQPFSLLIGAELYTLCFRVVLSKYRAIMGLFQQAKYRPLAGMMINLLVSIALVKRWGICGVLVGTIVADWTTMMWFDPIIIHRYGFGNEVPVTRYFGKFFRNFMTVCTVGALDWLICRYIFVDLGWISVILHSVICGITVPAALLAFNIRSEEGQYVYKLGMGYVHKVLRKVKK